MANHNTASSSDRKEKKRGVRLLGLLPYLLAAALLLTGITFSSYVTTVTGGESARVARFEVKAESIQGNSFMLTPGEAISTQTYNLRVESDSEVAVEYDIVLKNVPVGISVKLGSKTLQADANGEIRFEKVGTFAANDTNSKDHALTFSASVAVEVASMDIQVSVDFRQID